MTKILKKRIIEILNELSINPRGGDIEKMEGEKNSWRRRIGDYRIFYEINQSNKVIFVYNIKRRTSSAY